MLSRMLQAALRTFFWGEYSTRQQPQIQRLRHLVSSPVLTDAEQKEREGLLLNLSGGFCLGGTLLHDRTPAAVEIAYHPLQPAPSLRPLAFGETGFWGVRNLIWRMLLGIDPDLYTAVLASGRWSGTPADLSNLVNQGRLVLPGILPLRDAIDWIYASVYSTIKAMKFSQLAPVCGGPVEVAVITTDRPFRWVCHKGLDAAVPRRGTGSDEKPY